MRELSLKPLTVFGTGQCWRQGWEDGLDLELACTNLQDWLDSPDFAVIVCCRRVGSVASSQFVVAEGTDVDHPLAEGGNGVEAVAVQDRYFA